MSRENSGKGSVRFAEYRCPSAAASATAAATATDHLDVSLGLLLVGGIYTTDLLLLQASPQAQQAAGGSPPQPPQQLPQPEVRNLTASNLSIGLEPAAPASAGSQDQQQQRLVLRLWAEQEGPLSADFTLVLSPDQEVGVHVSATVFSRKKGTPGLKPHVRCLGFSADTDTEAASDWQGF